MILQIIQVIGILIPLMGIAALVYSRRHSSNTIRLTLANVGCLIMNSAYLLIMIAKNSEEALPAMKIQYFGQSVFYIFLILFVISYMKVKVPHFIIWLFIIFEGFFIANIWADNIRDTYLGHFSFDHNSKLGIMVVSIDPKLLYFIRCSLTSVLLTAGLIYTIIRIKRTAITYERMNFVRLAGAQFVIVISLIVHLTMHYPIDIVPLFGSLSIIAIILSIIADEFFGVTDSGNEWAIQQMDDPYILVDSAYCFLNANEPARALFIELDGMEFGDTVTRRIKNLFQNEDKNCEVIDNNNNKHYFEKKVTELKQKDRVVGYAMLLDDDTDEHILLDLTTSYNETLERDVKVKTEHIQMIQDSIITGMASVVESRDNSTGGHINRTSNIIRTFADVLRINSKKLGIDEEFIQDLIKAAPMHDIGKIAVDDVVLRKSGRFTDEEYEIMKKHASEGAKMLRKILNEVDDERFVQIAVNVAQYHHERWDGGGYPNGVSGEAIPIEARIMALADVLDALMSKRYYKEPMPADEAFGIIEAGLGTQFDPVIGRLFLQCRPEIEHFYLMEELW